MENHIGDINKMVAPAEPAKPRSVQRDGSAAASTCLHCDYWTLRSSGGTDGMQGWCDLFAKRTAADHGRKCTGWTIREPLNAES